MATTKKAGDSLIPKKGEVIVAKDQSGAVAVIHKGEQTAEQWGQHVDAAMGSGHEVFKDGVRVETPPNASNAPPPRAVPVPSTSASNPDPMGDVVVPSNGATQRQVTEGGTPGTYHERPVLDAVVNGAKALATTMPLANPDGPVAGLKEAGDGLKDSASALGLTPAPVTEKKTDDKPKAAEEQKLAEAPAGLGGPGAGGGAPAVPEENAMDRAFAIINKNHALAAVEENKADTAHRLSLASTDMAITERKFADQMMQADQIQKQAEDSVQKHIDAIQAEQAKLDPTINRDKYWQEKSGAQIAAGALAAACFGFAGKGMDYLKMIQAEVDANVQAQQMSFDNARGNLKDQRQGFENQFERAMKQGLSRKAAIESVRIATISSMQAQIQAITQQGISDVGMANMQVIAEGLGGDLLDAHQKAQMEGVRMGKERSATFLNYAQAEAMRAKARNAGKTGSGLSKNAEKSIQEVDTATENARSNLLKARAIIEKSGSVNLTGEEDTELNQALDFYAVYAAKVKDPNSIVSTTEAKRERNSLGVDTGISSMGTRNSVYIEVIDATIKKLDEQKAATRRNRGVSAGVPAADDGTGFSGEQ